MVAITSAIAGSFACSPAEPRTLPPLGSSAKSGASSAPAQSLSAIASVTAAPSGEPAAAPIVEKPPSISFAEALDITYPTGAPSEAKQCSSVSAGGAGTNGAETRTASAAQEEEDIRCLLSARFAGDAKARGLAVDLYSTIGIVTGVGRDQLMDGGWRGEIHLVPELPVGQYRRHLEWVKSGFDDIDEFFAYLDSSRGTSPRATYRYRALGLRFMRSVGRTTPSAYAQGWEVAYNVSGSLHASADAVRETLFHEVFHTNDASHNGWSQRVLGPINDAILAKCGQRSACLAPYAPGTTMVRGGTYYAFQTGNGVGEYAAELATRYFLEHRAIFKGKRHGKGSFKCGPPENAKAWRAIVDEFFGADLTPACGAK